MASQRCLCPNSWKLWICYLSWQKGLRSCAKVKDLEMERLSWNICVDPMQLQVLRSREPFPPGTETDVTLLVLKMEEKGHEPKIMGISRSWKSIPCCSLWKGAMPCWDSLNRPWRDSCWISDPQKCKIISMDCFKSQVHGNLLQSS